MKYGVDVSWFQQKVDWQQLRRDGHEFASVRVAEGLDLDTMHDTHVKNALSEGFRVGSYQIGHPSMDVTKLAEFFLKHAFIQPGHMQPVPDMETLATGPDGKKRVPTNAGPWTNDWCEIVKRKAQVEPLPYASPSYWLEACKQCSDLGGEEGWDWWMAWYCGAIKPTKFEGEPLIYVAHQFAGNISMAPHQVGLWDRDVVYADTLDMILIPKAA